MNAHKSIRIFQNEWMESWTHIHPAWPFVVWVPIVGVFFVRGFSTPDLTFASVVTCGVLTLLFWSFTEYMLHRFLFHFPAKSRAGRWFVFFIHGVHHDDPQDPTRLVMPPFASLVLGVVFYGFFYVTVGSWVDLTFAFFATGYLFYDFTHFAVHHFRQRTPIGRFLKQNHMLHHYAEPNTRWGVSSPLWDLILGTAGKKAPSSAR